MGLYTPFVKYARGFTNRAEGGGYAKGVERAQREGGAPRFVCPSCGDTGWMATSCPRCDRAFVEVRPDGLPAPLVDERLVRASHRLSTRRMTALAPRARMRLAERRRARRRRRLLRRAGACVAVEQAVGRDPRKPVRIAGRVRVLDGIAGPDGAPGWAGYVLRAMYDAPCDCPDPDCPQVRRWARLESRLGRLVVLDAQGGAALLDTRGLDWDVVPADDAPPSELGRRVWRLREGDEVEVVGHPHRVDARAVASLGGYRQGAGPAAIVLKASSDEPLMVRLAAPAEAT